MTMQLSAAGEAFIKQYERFRPTAYLPTRKDKWTCGWGHTGPDVGPNTTCDMAQAEAWFKHDTTWACATVNAYIHRPMTQNQFDSLVSLCFNIGAPAFEESTLVRKFNDGDIGGAALEFLKWHYQNHQDVPGLDNRREAEEKLFLK